MDSLTKKQLIEKLRDLSGRLSQLGKVTTSAVPGVMLVREDLGIRTPRKNKSNILHGQRHSQPTTTNRITPPSGLHLASNSARVASFYQDWDPGK